MAHKGHVQKIEGELLEAKVSSDSTIGVIGIVVIWISILLWIAFFIGDPDLHDAVIHYLMN